MTPLVFLVFPPSVGYTASSRQKTIQDGVVPSSLTCHPAYRDFSRNFHSKTHQTVYGVASDAPKRRHHLCLPLAYTPHVAFSITWSLSLSDLGCECDVKSFVFSLWENVIKTQYGAGVKTM